MNDLDTVYFWSARWLVVILLVLIKIPALIAALLLAYQRFKAIRDKDALNG